MLMLVSGGVWTGVIVAYAVERTRLWARMPLQQYVVDFRRSLYCIDPMQPILLALTGVGAVVFALGSSRTASTLAWVGVALLALVFVATVTITEPMNARFRRLQESDVPPGAEQMRVRWRRFHLFRTTVAVAALFAWRPPSPTSEAMSEPTRVGAPEPLAGCRPSRSAWTERPQERLPKRRQKCA
jgi:hypothetical protein